MPKRMQYSDVIISRSGSSTTNEIVFYKKPSILIPYPYAIDDHQYYNAKTLSQYSCSTLIRNENLNSTRLTIEIFKSIFVPAKKKYIKSKLSRINSLNSAEKMIQILKLDLNGHK
jgi:UDP-N-acetylglucosamine--N-acetylmuramyl-(pentapeptide) pyrophosphoryl-undecaprenol N-acetylglucosamine transferase